MAEDIAALFNLPCNQCPCKMYEECDGIMGECVECGHMQSMHSTIEEQMPVILEGLVLRGKTDKAILGYLRAVGLNISFGTLRKWLLKHNIRRNEGYLADDILRAVKRQMDKCDQKAGYRRLHKYVRQNEQMKVTRDEVEQAMKVVDAKGPCLRRQRRLRRRVFVCNGPNELWSIDQHDKLASFGIYIHGALDAWSRKVLWCKTYTTNKNPSFVAQYFLETVENGGVVPEQTRTDRGTENIILAECQMFLRRNCEDLKAGIKSNIVGKSKFNQKIECFWSGVYERCTRSWWETFVEMKRQGKLEEQYWEAFLFVFFPLVENTIKEYVSWWNDHIIRSQRNIALPSGSSPNDMYHLYEMYGGKMCGFPAYISDLHSLRQYHDIPSTLPSVVSESFRRRATDVLHRNGVQCTFDSATACYDILITELCDS